MKCIFEEVCLGSALGRCRFVVWDPAWDLEGHGLKPRHPQATFDPKLPKNMQKINKMTSRQN